MSESSDVEVIEIDQEMDEFYENDIEEVIVGSSCTEDEDPLEIEKKPPPKEITQIARKVRNEEIHDSYDYLQTAILAVNEVPSVKWKRTKTLNKGIVLCQDLMQQEVNLMVEAEALLQENWLLKKRVEKLRRKKKRKTVTVLTRRASGPILGAPKTISPERKRASLDDSKINIVPDKEAVDKVIKEESTETIVNINRNPRRKSRKRSGLTEEEKEFYLLEEKIEDLLNEVDALWNEVNEEDEEHTQENMDTTKCETKEQVKENIEEEKKVEILAKSEPETQESKQEGLENLLIRSFQIIPSPSKGLFDKNVNCDAGFPFQISLQPDTTLHKLGNEPTTSIIEELPPEKGTGSTEVINISDGSDSESSVVCIG